jgi:hypothetical protein
MSNATLQLTESTFRVKVREIIHGQKLTSVCYVKSTSSDKASLQAAIDKHPLNVNRNWNLVKIKA